MQKDTDLFDTLRDLTGQYSNKIIMEDLNGNLLSATDADAITIKSLAEELSLQIVQHGPTHHKTPTSHTWIDVILTDKNDTILDQNNQHLPSFGKHAIIDVTIDIFIPTFHTGAFEYRLYNKICPPHTIIC